MLNYVEYLYDLARELDCGLRLAPNLDGMMYVEFGYVEGPHPDTSHDRYTPQQAFAVGLHELGHFHHGHTQGRPPFLEETEYFNRGVLRSEAEAWDYALHHLQICEEMGFPLQDNTRAFMWGRCLNSYFSSAQRLAGRPTRLGNGDRGYVVFVFDEPGALFNEVRDRLVAA